jgi:hypothetical protein
VEVEQRRDQAQAGGQQHRRPSAMDGQPDKRQEQDRGDGGELDDVGQPRRSGEQWLEERVQLGVATAVEGDVRGQRISQLSNQDGGLQRLYSFGAVLCHRCRYLLSFKYPTGRGAKNKKKEIPGKHPGLCAVLDDLRELATHARNSTSYLLCSEFTARSLAGLRFRSTPRAEALAGLLP